MATTEIAKTPLMKQYEQMKAKHPDAVLLFRVGDFYETFSDDAITVSEICGITLTRRANGSAKAIELAGFPHHALDTYIPKIVRAGKRVAICEQQDSPKPEAVELITPGKSGTPKEEQPKEDQPKPSKPTIRRIGCEKDLREKGEPIAWFTIDIPKEAKNLNKCINNKKHGYIMPQLTSICVVPEYGKLYATNTHILQSVAARCDGEWPVGVEKESGGTIYYQPFQCNIDAKAINYLAGKTVDVAVWQNEDGKLDVTACEAVGVLTQYDESKRRGNSFPNAERIISQSRDMTIKLRPAEIKKMRDWVKANVGKLTPNSSGEWYENNRLRLHTAPEADSVMLSIEAEGEDFEWHEVSTAYFDLAETVDTEISIWFCAPLFYLSVDGDFNGEISIADNCHPASFAGVYRTSVLMPMSIPEREQ